MSLNKRRIGELYDLPIVTGDLNMVNNHELLLEMNDDNTPKALKQRVNGDLFKTILGEGSGSNNTNPGYNVTKQTVTLFNDTIETQELGGIYQAVVENIDFDLIAGENYTVVFDGISYDIKATTFNGQVLLGEGDSEGPSFETYPFAILYDIYNIHNEEIKVIMLFTNIEGSHTVVIKQEEKTVTTTPEFKSAVDSVTGYSIDKEYETLFDGTVETEDAHRIITPTITFVKDDTYKVIFNGIEYTCKCFDNDGDLTIGAPFDYEEETYDWSTYPFCIATYPSGQQQYETGLDTNQEGPCTLKIEHITASTKTTPEFVSMIQGIAGCSDSGCQIIYPDSISWVDTVYSQYNKEPEAGNIYFIPFSDTGSPYGQYLYPVHIDELTNDDNEFGGSATIIGNPIIIDSGTLTAQPFNHTINPESGTTKGLCIAYIEGDNNYRLGYGDMMKL